MPLPKASQPASLAAPNEELNAQTGQNSAGESQSRQSPSAFRIPPILLEGDAPASPADGERAAAGQTIKSPAETASAQLPASYGLSRLSLLPREPQWLFATWDFSQDQQREAERMPGRRLALRVFLGELNGELVKEIPVHPDSRQCFIYIERPERVFAAELGFYLPERQWRTVASVPPVTLPSRGPSEERTVQFATFSVAPPQGASDQPSLPAPSPIPLPSLEPGQPLAPTTPMPEVAVPPLPPVPLLPEWSSAREGALAELIGWTATRQEGPSSAEISHLLEGRPEQPGLIEGAQPEQFVPGLAALEISSFPGGVPLEISSPGAGEMHGPKAFRLSVNAELVIYGATEPNAQVTIGGRPIQLREDGSFSYRFALPDGSYTLAIKAMAPQGEVRQANLEFYRHTASEGHVEQHPQDPGLKSPHSHDAL